MLFDFLLSRFGVCCRPDVVNGQKIAVEEVGQGLGMAVDVSTHSRSRLRIWRGDATGVATGAGENPADQHWPWWPLLPLSSQSQEVV